MVGLTTSGAEAAKNCKNRLFDFSYAFVSTILTSCDVINLVCYYQNLSERPLDVTNSVRYFSDVPLPVQNNPKFTKNVFFEICV